MKFNRNTVFDCLTKDISKVQNKSGNISVLENDLNIPFNIKRIYYLYDVPSGVTRGGHAHFKLEQYIIAVSGSFDVILDDGNNKRKITLNRPNLALHIVPGLWRELSDFSSGSITMVLASELYDEKDYIRNYKKFLKFKKK